MDRLKDKVAFITGAGAGIGRASAKMFAAEGAKVVIVEKNGDTATAAAEEIRKLGGQALAAETDITQENSVRAAVDKTIQTFGGLDILFNCAGGSVKEDAPVTDVDMSVWNITMGLNLLGTFLCCRVAIPTMVKQGGGTIVNTASWAALNGHLRKHVYAAAKGGVISLTRAIAGEYSQHNIRANVICPGSVKTERWLANAKPQAQLHALAEKYPLSRGEPSEIGAVALFLASDESRMMTGAIVTADGGRTAF